MVKLQIELSEEDVAILNRYKQLTLGKTQKAVANDAIFFLLWACAETEKGHPIISVDQAELESQNDGNSVRIYKECAHPLLLALRLTRKRPDSTLNISETIA